MNMEQIFSAHQKDPVFDIIEKRLGGHELDREDGYRLMESQNLLLLGALADHLRSKAKGEHVTFVLNRQINYSNICVSRCGFCAFYREKGSPGAYTMTLDEIMERADQAMEDGLTELHIVGSHHPDLPFGFYVQMLEDIKGRYPEVHIKAFTAAEIEYFSKISGKSIEQVLDILIKAGLDSMPGGGAEILDEDIRKQVCPNKISGQGWLDVMEKAHNMGLKSNATMLFGHIEKPRHRVDHIIKIRELQKKTRGFQSFIPLVYHPGNTRLLEEGLTGREPVGGHDILKTMAISRILLDGAIDNIRAYWVMTGKKIAQISLHFGANDIDGTVVEERITDAAGGTAGGSMTKEELIKMIREAGRIPARRNTLHEIIETW